SVPRRRLMQARGGDEAAGHKMVGLGESDDLALVDAVAGLVVASVGRGDVAGRLAAERLAGGKGFEGTQEQGLADMLAVLAGEDRGDRRLCETGLCGEAGAG